MFAERLFDRWGARAVFFGRFIALLRIFAGPLAGALKSLRRFLVANVSGALCWAGGTTALVYYAGMAAERWLTRFLGSRYFSPWCAGRLLQSCCESAHPARLPTSRPSTPASPTPPPRRRRRYRKTTNTVSASPFMLPTRRIAKKRVRFSISDKKFAGNCASTFLDLPQTTCGTRLVETP